MMRKNIVLLLLCIAGLAVQENQVQAQNTSSFVEQMKHAVAFFDQAFDKKHGVYWSDIDNEGHATSTTIYNVALSRSIYGLSYSSTWDKENLSRAKQCLEYQSAHLIIKDSTGWYFAPSTTQDSPNQNKTLDIWQQAYGLCGMSEYYRQTNDVEVLQQIHKLHEGFIARFYDKQLGGFWSEVDRMGAIKPNSKNIQSLMYPLTAYLGNLWLADVEHRSFYEPIICKTLERVYQVAWNDSIGWVNVDYNAQWEPTFSNDPQATPGHSFQLASLLLRTKQWVFLSEKVRDKYKQLGEEILVRTLKQPIYDQSETSFCSMVNVKTSKTVDPRKTWWQQCEAILALSLSEKNYEGRIKKMIAFFDQHFIDKRYGGEYFYLSEQNEPDLQEAKGSIGKSMYHTIEMYRFGIEQNQCSNKRNEKIK